MGRILRATALALAGLAIAALAPQSTLQTAKAETIAVIGTGEVGSALGKPWAKAGHVIIYGSRTPGSDKVKALVKETGHGAKAATPREAAAQAEIVLLAVPWRVASEAVPALGNLAGKIVIDPMNYFVAVDGYPGPLAGPSVAQQVKAWLPGAIVVKAFNTFALKMLDPKIAGGPITVPIAGDDLAAKTRVARLVTEVGLEPLDVGPLTAAAHLESMEQLYLGYRMYNRGKGKGFEFHLRPVPDTVFPVK